MGGGIALKFKNAFPANFREYETTCKRKEVQLGRMFVVETGDMVNPSHIVNFPTKRHRCDLSRMEDIDSGPRDPRRVIEERNIGSIAVPAPGCGLGDLDWQQTRSHIEDVLGGLDVTTS